MRESSLATTGHMFSASPAYLVVPGAHGRIKCDGPDGRLAEGHFQVLVTVLVSAFMSALAATV